MGFQYWRSSSPIVGMRGGYADVRMDVPLAVELTAPLGDWAHERAEASACGSVEAMSLDERVAKWRRLAICNTIAAAIVVGAVWAFASPVLAAVVTAIMVVAVVDIWFLARRTGRTGNPFLRAAPKSGGGG